MLLYVGSGCTGTHAARWKAFIETRVRRPCSGRTLWALASISFSRSIASVQTVLFYQLSGSRPATRRPPLRSALGCVAGFVGLGLLAG